MGVPFLDLKRQFETIREDVTAAMLAVSASQEFVLGRNVRALEQELANTCAVKHCIGVSSGTDALLATMMALGIGPGDEVIVPSFSFVASADTVARLGARPVFADIDPSSYNVAPESVASLVGPRTKGVIAVHLFGQCADVKGLRDVLGKDIWILEDCAQAICAEQGGQHAGTMGVAGCFSLYPTKNLGAFGDGGFITTNDDGLADRLRAIRSHGGTSRYHHDRIGGCFRLDELQAAIVRVKLPHLASWSNRRRAVASTYDALLRARGLVEARDATLPAVSQNNVHVFNQYVVRARDREALREHLGTNGIETMIYYPRPLHLQPCFAENGARERRLPKTEAACQEVLALPCYPEIAEREQEEVVAAVASFYGVR